MKFDVQTERQPRWPRFQSIRRNRRVNATVLISLGALVSVATISVVTVGALSGVTQSPPNAPSTPVGVVKWVVPHSQLGAPIVPIAGGATNGAGSFNAVSCPSATTCVAVGADGNLNGVASMSLNSGATWSQGTVDVNEPELNAVDCFNASTCVAVGDGATVRSIDGGKTWTSSTIPSKDTTLLGVSCSTSTMCVSVGVSPSSSGPFAGQLLTSSDGGTSWTAPALPASIGGLGSVDCPSSTFCVAVGSSVVVSVDGGTTWSLRTVKGGSGVLRSVSCLSATSCVAVGGNPAVAQNPNSSAYEDVTTDGGVTWTSLSLPAGSATLDVVSCSKSGCEAAGSSYNGAPTPVLVTSSGNTWTLNQSLSSSATAFSALSCTSATTCVFVGENGTSPITVATVNGVTSSTHPVSAQVRSQKDVTQ